MEVEAIGTFRLLLRTGYFLDLKDIYVVLSLDGIWFMFLYWISFGYCCSFGNGKFSLFQNSNLLQLVLYLVLTIFICLIQMPCLMNPCM